LGFAACANSTSTDSNPAGDGTGSGNGGSSGSTGTGGSGGGGGTVDTNHNPFAGAQVYVNPAYVREAESSVSMDPADAAQLAKMKTSSTAIWLDSIAKVDDVGHYLDDAKQQQTASGRPVVTTFVIYDLPDRDCAALASNGELSSANGGLETYKTRY